MPSCYPWGLLVLAQGSGCCPGERLLVWVKECLIWLWDIPGSLITVP